MGEQNVELKLYRILPKYVEALRDVDHGGDASVYKVEGNKSNRPFIGIITIFNKHNYFIPLTSYKERFKYLTAREIDFTPIYRRGKLIAGIEFNKMIPVPLNQVRPLDMEIHKHDDDKTQVAKQIRKYEYNWCNMHKDEIVKKTQNLYTMYIDQDIKYKNIKYCLNFPQMEKLCVQYELEHPAQY